MATYVNDLRLKEIATGDESGTWGTSTNTNLELIGEALGFGTEAITTNADTHTTTVADGSTDPGRAMYLKYTGTLDSACTITIAPNTISRMQFIENGTSGSQNIIISQGSGANITIPPGDTKAVYLDGAGSGAAVVDAFASLNVVDLKVQDDLTVTDDLIVNGDIDLEGAIDVNGTANLDVVDIDGAVDMASTLQVDGAITSSAGATITLADNTDNLTLTTTDADASVGPNLRMYRNSGSPADNDLVGAIDFEGRNDNSQDVVYSQIFTQILDASDGTEDGYLSFKVMNAGTSRQRLLFDAGETVFNDESEDVDFRVESNGNANMLFVDAGNDYVAMGASTDLSGALNITHGAEFGLVTSGPFNFQAKFESTDAEAAIVIEDSNSGTDYNRIGVITNDMAFTTNNSEKIRIQEDGVLLLKGGTVTGVQEITFNNSAASVNDGSTLTLSGILNTGALIAIGANRSNLGVTYDHCLLFAETGTAFVTLADPSSRFAINSATTANKVNVFVNSNSVVIQNEVGTTVGITASYFRFQGN